MKQKKVIIGVAVLVMVNLIGCSNSQVPEESSAVMVEQDRTEKQSSETNELQSSESMSVTMEEVSEVQASTNESSPSSIYLADMPDTEDKILEKVEIRTEKTIKGDIVVFVTNNNDYSIPDIELQAIFYKDGNIIDTDKDGHDVVIPKNTVVSKMEASGEYDDFKVKASIDWDTGSTYRNWTNNLEVNHNLGNRNVIIQFENQGKVDIRELEYIVVFYQDGEIVDTSYANDVYDVDSGDVVVEEVSTYGNKFDEYEVYVNQAHTFDEDYVNGEIIRDTFSENIGSKNNSLSESENEQDRTPKMQEYQEDIEQTDTLESSQEQSKIVQTVTSGQANALKQAQSYLKISAFSYKGLKDQLEYEEFAEDEIQYAVDNCGADWKEQALRQAQSYLNLSAFSYEGLVDQLKYEDYTDEQAVYGADNCGADWMEQAVKQAKSYLEISSFSKSELIEQLEYEGYTYEQAVYGAEQNGF